MEELAKEVSPFHRFSREEWAALRADTPMTLIQADLDELRSLNDRIDLTEVETIYLPLSRLLKLYVAATQGLFRATNHFLHLNDRKVPYIIGMAGSVAVGKSTTARILQRLLARWPQPAQGRSRHHRRVPPAQRGSRARRPDDPQGLPGKLRPPRHPALHVRHQGGQAQCHGAGLFASHL